MFEHKIPVTLPDGYVDFFKNLESWENEELIKLRNVYAPSQLDILRMLDETKKPLILQVNPHIEADTYREVFERLLDFLNSTRPEIGPQLALIKNNLDKVNFENIISSFITMQTTEIEKAAETAAIPGELFFFVVDHALRPFLRIFAEPYRNDLVSEHLYWDFSSTCPVCGSKSHFSRLQSEDGQRFMFCDRCFSEWKVRYLFCVHCGHDRPGDIRYLNVENDEAYKLYLCDNCKGYLKTFDERPGGDMVDLFIANIETIYLDILAQEKGYTSHDE